MPQLRATALAAIALCLSVAAQPALAQQAAPPPDDSLNAVLWTQNAVEFKGNALAIYALARIRLDEALADPTWTAAPEEQKGDFQKLPPAVVLDVDETVLDTSAYQAWTVVNGKSFSGKTWTPFVNANQSEAVPGAVDFTKYAESKGVKVFYVTNRTKEEEAGSRTNMERLGFPMGGNVDTFLASKEQEGWGSAKGTRRAVVAKDYRILLLVGDNLGDFTDAYKGSEADRLKVYQDTAAHWGHDWLVIPNPTYGSWESAPYLSNYDLTPEQRRAAKQKALRVWDGK